MLRESPNQIYIYPKPVYLPSGHLRLYLSPPGTSHAAISAARMVSAVITDLSKVGLDEVEKGEPDIYALYRIDREVLFSFFNEEGNEAGRMRVVLPEGISLTCTAKEERFMDGEVWYEFRKEEENISGDQGQ